MGLDIRLPIGLMFAIFGLLLAGYGLISDKTIYRRSLGVNINLWWGLALLAFGAVMLVLGRRGTSTMRPTEMSPEGRLLEKIEKERDLESPGRQ